MKRDNLALFRTGKALHICATYLLKIQGHCNDFGLKCLNIERFAYPAPSNFLSELAHYSNLSNKRAAQIILF